MKTTVLLILTAFLLAACNKEPEKAPKAPLHYRAETQRAAQHVVTIWSQSPDVSAGSNRFKLQFQTPEKLPAMPGKVEVVPILVETGKTQIPGHGEVQASDEPGIYDVVIDLPTAGRWRINISFDADSLAFYYTAR